MSNDPFVEFVNTELPKRISTAQDPTTVTAGKLLVAKGVGLEVEFINPEDIALEGKSAYDIAVADGFVGTEKEWLLTLPGKNGDNTEVLVAKTAAEVAAAKAESARNGAEAARDTFNLNVGRKTSIADGLASTTNDQTFTIVSPDNNEYIIEYKNLAGSAVEVKRYPSVSAVTSVTARVAVVEAPVEALDIRPSKNLYNNAKHVLGGSFNTTTGGDTTLGGTWYRSEYIKITAGKTYKFSLAPIPVAANMSYALYDASKVFISGAASASSVDAPVNAAYLRVSFNWGSAVTAIVAETVLPSVYVPYRFELTGNNPDRPLYILPSVIAETIKASGAPMTTGLSSQLNYVTEKNASFIDTPLNLLDYESRIAGKNINSSTGLEVTVSGWWATDFIPVLDDGATYRGTTKSATINVMPQPQFSIQGFTGAWYDVNKKWLAAIVNLNVLVAPAGAAFVRLSSNSASPEKVMFTKGPNLPIRYERYRNSVDLLRVQQVLPIYWGKRLCSLGDSFTQLNMYAAKLCEVTGLQQTKNFGVSGQLLKTMADSLTASSLDDIDVVTLWGGTNDYGHGNCALGTISDTKETTSIYGILRYLIDKILTIKPTVRLFFFTPTNRGVFLSEPIPPALNSYGLSIQSIGKAMMEVCREMSVPCCDIGGIGGINQYTLPLYTADNLHPNQLGADMLGALMGKFINTHGTPL